MSEGLLRIGEVGLGKSRKRRGKKSMLLVDWAWYSSYEPVGCYTCSGGEMMDDVQKLIWIEEE